MAQSSVNSGCSEFSKRTSRMDGRPVYSCPPLTSQTTPVMNEA
jgi:hypothetical protein